MTTIAKKLEELSHLPEKELMVGFLKHATYPDGKSVVEVAIENEFGAPHRKIPPRPFFRNAIEKNKQKWVDLISKMIANGEEDVEKVLRTVGVVAIGDIQDSIIDLDTPPNAPLTIKLKGFNNPLIHTRVMLKSVEMEIVDDKS